jgi:hypothetical protein
MSQGAPQPELPGNVKWPKLTIKWWEAWGRSEYAAHLSETDWLEMLEAALLHAKFWSGDDKVAGELRARVERIRKRRTSAQPPSGLIRMEGDHGEDLPTFV